MRQMEMKSQSLENGETLTYRYMAGGKDRIILVHGNLASSAFYDEIMEGLPENFEIIALDMRGFGDSSYHRPIDTLRDLAGDLKLFVDAIGWDKFDLLGWSTGGAVSMYFCISYGHYVNRLFLIDSAGLSGYHSYEVLANGEKKLITTKEGIAHEPGKVALFDAHDRGDKVFYKAVWGQAIYNQSKPEDAIYDKHMRESLKQRNLVDIYHGLNSFNISDYYNGVTMGTNEARRVEVPVIMIQGDSDLLVSVEEAKELRQALGDKAKLIIAPHCGHSPMVDAPQLMIDAIVGKI